MSALAHDVGHPGFTNDFLKNTSAELALRYSDDSVLERMHAATMFGVLQKQEARAHRGVDRVATKGGKARRFPADAVSHRGSQTAPASQFPPSAFSTPSVLAGRSRDTHPAGDAVGFLTRVK